MISRITRRNNPNKKRSISGKISIEFLKKLMGIFRIITTKSSIIPQFCNICFMGTIIYITNGDMIIAYSITNDDSVPDNENLQKIKGCVNGGVLWKFFQKYKGTSELNFRLSNSILTFSTSTLQVEVPVDDPSTSLYSINEIKDMFNNHSTQKYDISTNEFRHAIKCTLPVLQGVGNSEGATFQIDHDLWTIYGTNNMIIVTTAGRILNKEEAQSTRYILSSDTVKMLSKILKEFKYTNFLCFYDIPDKTELLCVFHNNWMARFKYYRKQRINYTAITDEILPQADQIFEMKNKTGIINVGDFKQILTHYIVSDDTNIVFTVGDIVMMESQTMNINIRETLPDFTSPLNLPNKFVINSKILAMGIKNVDKIVIIPYKDTVVLVGRLKNHSSIILGN